MGLYAQGGGWSLTMTDPVDIESPIHVGILAKDSGFASFLSALVGGTDHFTSAGVFRSLPKLLREGVGADMDILLVDLGSREPGDDPVEDYAACRTVAKIREALPQVRIIALTPVAQPDLIPRLFEAGAVGCLAKPVDPPYLVNAIQEAFDGGAPMCRQIARLVIQDLHRRGMRRLALASLTMQEHRILEFMAQGLNRRKIAALLGISPFTISTHLRNIFSKLEVHSQAQAVARFLGQDFFE